MEATKRVHKTRYIHREKEHRDKTKQIHREALSIKKTKKQIRTTHKYRVNNKHDNHNECQEKRKENITTKKNNTHSKISTQQ